LLVPHLCRAVALEGETARIDKTTATPRVNRSEHLHPTGQLATSWWTGPGWLNSAWPSSTVCDGNCRSRRGLPGW